jgi:hypothetical protein
MKNAADILIEVLEVHGLPSGVGARGRTSRYIKYAIKGEQTPIIESSEGLKGWIALADEDKEKLSDLDSIQSVIKAFIEDSTAGDYLLYHDKNGEEHFLELAAFEPHTESHDFEVLIDESEFAEILFKATGNMPDSVEDLDLMNFCLDQCEEVDWETSYTFGYGVAWLTFLDGFQIGFTKEDGVIVAIDQDA